MGTHWDQPRSDELSTACPLLIYSNICEVEPNRQGNTKMARKRTKGEGLRDKMSERKASPSDILSLNLSILVLFLPILVLLCRFSSYSHSLNKCAMGSP